MARKFWTLLPETYYSSKQLAKGGRNEIVFTAIGCFIYYLSYRSFHKKPEASTNHIQQIVNGSKWF